MKGKNKDLTFAWDKKALVELGVPILAGFLVFSSLVRTVAPFPDILIALITGLFMGLFFRDLKRAAIAGFLVGSIGSFIFEFLPSSIAFLGLPNSIVFFFQGLIVMLGSILTASIRAKEIKKLVIFVLMGFILMNFALNATVLNSGILQVASYEPPAEEYAFDGFIYLKTFYLLKGGMNYYKANGVATIQDARFSRLPWQVQFFRLPTMFFLWKWFLPSNGAYIVYAFILISMVSLFASYLFARKFAGDLLGLLAPFLLAPYLTYGARSWWFPFAEYWALPFALLSLVFFSRNRWILSALFAFLAVIFRELFITIIFAGLLAGLFSRDRRKILIWMAPVLAFALAEVVHCALAQPIMSVGNLGGFFHTHYFKGGLWYFHVSSMFGMNYYGLPGLMRLLMVIIGMAGVVAVFGREAKLFYGTITMLPALSFMLGIKDDIYWGIIYMPFVMVCVPLFLGFLRKRFTGDES